MAKEERLYWLAFSAFTPIGPKRFSLLLDYFGSAKNAWKAERHELLKIGLSQNLVSSLERFKKSFDPASYFNQLKCQGISFLTIKEKDFPKNLKEIDDCPFLLYVKGKLKPEDSLAISVVGSRKATSYGRQVTASLVTDLALAKITIVSGLAYGVDSVAHRTALEVGGRTIGVWAGGLDTLSGFRKNLAEEIIKKGSAIISEFPLGFSPNKTSFPRRNRIISGLSLGVLVTEAAKRSGSLITASYAATQGREVFAVPGPVTSFFSEGTAFLLKSGAKLVLRADDILEELEIKKRPDKKSYKIIPETKEEGIVLLLLQEGEKSLDELVRSSKMKVDQVLPLLTMMEIKGKIKKGEGGNYTLIDKRD